MEIICPIKTKYIRELRTLKSAIRLDGSKGTKARVRFIILAFESGLHDSINRYELFDEHDLGERDIDNCLEQSDSAEVVHRILKEMNSDPTLNTIISSHLGCEVLDHWRSISERFISSQTNQIGLFD
ncbi:hypothetical protein [Vibrio mediterranei]|uniref:hypothetical protein n=1 Tax=Vibrio mediterranei TaxID=689 RepID=UPI004068E5C4